MLAGADLRRRRAQEPLHPRDCLLALVRAYCQSRIGIVQLRGGTGYLLCRGVFCLIAWSMFLSSELAEVAGASGGNGDSNSSSAQQHSSSGSYAAGGSNNDGDDNNGDSYPNAGAGSMQRVLFGACPLVPFSFLLALLRGNACGDHCQSPYNPNPLHHIRVALRWLPLSCRPATKPKQKKGRGWVHRRVHCCSRLCHCALVSFSLSGSTVD